MLQHLADWSFAAILSSIDAVNGWVSTNECFACSPGKSGLSDHLKILPMLWCTLYVGHQSSQRFKAMKRSCVGMPKDDGQLCVARAIVTARGLHLARATLMSARNGRALDSVYDAAAELPVPCWAKSAYILDPMAPMN